MKNVLILLISLAVFACLIVHAAPIRGAINTWRFGIQKTDDATSYETIRKVEDTCRAMQASYKTDTLTYGQYRNSADAEKQGWAEQAKMRANKTASPYNTYIMKNSFVWKGNVPSDIAGELKYVE